MRHESLVTLSQSGKPRAAYELQVFIAHTAFAFPCDVQGQVDLDLLDERGRNDYFFARAVMKLRPGRIEHDVVSQQAPQTQR